MKLTPTVILLASLSVQGCSSRPTSLKPINNRNINGATEIDRSACDPNYSDCVPIASDVDCAGGKGDGPAYVKGPVKVIGEDIYRLDKDRDGIGCE